MNCYANLTSLLVCVPLHVSRISRESLHVSKQAPEATKKKECPTFYGVIEFSIITIVVPKIDDNHNNFNCKQTHPSANHILCYSFESFSCSVYAFVMREN